MTLKKKVKVTFYVLVGDTRVIFISQGIVCPVSYSQKH